MKTEKGKTALDMIKPTSFYSCESEKIKLNWYCYELAMGIYDEARNSLGEKLEKYKINNKTLAEF